MCVGWDGMNEWLSQVIGPGYDELGFLTLGQVWVGFDQKAWVSGSGSCIVHIMILGLIIRKPIFLHPKSLKWPFSGAKKLGLGTPEQKNGHHFSSSTIPKNGG